MAATASSVDPEPPQVVGLDYRVVVYVATPSCMVLGSPDRQKDIVYNSMFFDCNLLVYNLGRIAANDCIVSIMQEAI
ncbi:hypothetical protein SeMB42_g03531 [Synchytrium endobioticum]|uniref:Uncharacterized protein n=1 Tax=Synchytrium endobioticum TaxID=286115 RepID=A0A507D6H5_9FUNG|nr:hypothetical protein SeMB42_g03531 [Synchytrium endobioticum]